MLTILVATFVTLCSLIPFYLLLLSQLESLKQVNTENTKNWKNTKTLIDSFYNKVVNDIMSGNLSSIISEHLIQFLIEPSNFTKKSSQMIYKHRFHKNLDKLKFRTDLLKLTGRVFARILIQILYLSIFLKM